MEKEREILLNKYSEINHSKSKYNIFINMVLSNFSMIKNYLIENKKKKEFTQIINDLIKIEDFKKVSLLSNNGLELSTKQKIALIKKMEHKFINKSGNAITTEGLNFLNSEIENYYVPDEILKKMLVLSAKKVYYPFVEKNQNPKYNFLIEIENLYNKYLEKQKKEEEENKHFESEKFYVEYDRLIS